MEFQAELAHTLNRVPSDLSRLSELIDPAWIAQTLHATGKASIRPDHAPKLARLLARLDAVTCAPDMNVPGWGLHPLSGDLANHSAVSVNGNWRMTFTFDGTDAVLVDYMD